MALWGTPEAVAQVTAGPLAKLLAAGGEFQGYKTRIITVHMPFVMNQDSLPGKQTFCQNVTRNVLLVTPTTFRNSMDYIVSHQQWSCSIVLHLIHILDVPSLPFITFGWS